ncbi:MAG: rod-binding protein [Deltaproteobacteria bacterium]|nr:rod-binding protein [Deltaproteobacteria bacterium]
MGHFDFLLHLNPQTVEGPKADKKVLKQACEEFEALFWEQLLKGMRKTIPKSEFWGNRREEELYTSLYDQGLSVVLSERGGLGLAEMLMKQMEPAAEHSSTGTEGEEAAADGTQAGEEPE